MLQLCLSRSLYETRANRGYVGDEKNEGICAAPRVVLHETHQGRDDTVCHCSLHQMTATAHGLRNAAACARPVGTDGRTPSPTMSNSTSPQKRGGRREDGCGQARAWSQVHFAAGWACSWRAKVFWHPPCPAASTALDEGAQGCGPGREVSFDPAMPFPRTRKAARRRDALPGLTPWL